ncbi:hypothetical protein CO038_03840 [Candidatus Pacearchaeota archaeon CG_4_9_14_0_2_um_filter_39_13]|nr:CBS domain-containing protein [Candidatus Pacearchaeota archaeon]OIO43174.1 MAG: hypothetical protein AUJ64_02785 [Candidatus Pacearchaeota archaeon CG1_02_39_14]PJC44424.1 MAG: hypothetical protein CO038_03840 [Candidatus Pacearchaeota archaeon CG_4_9_14_0_2_um_filter_39_13]
MLKRIAVGDVMTRHFASVSPETNLLKCSKEFVRQRLNSLVIVNGRKLVGILTQRDVLWALTKKPGLDLRKVKAIDVATKKVAVIKPSADIREALEKMKRYGFRRLPVISRGQIVGVLTLKDILAIEPAFYSNLGSLVDIREESEKLKKAREEDTFTDGFCEECNTYSDLLKVEGRFLCEACREELY